jgi:hypothetical protein
VDRRASKYLRQLGLDAKALKGWEVNVFTRAGFDVGIVITKGPEIHFVSLSEKKALTRHNIRSYIAPLLEQHGYATTRVPLGVTDHKLREHLGFMETWRDEHCSYWALTELPYQRK